MTLHPHARCETCRSLHRLVKQADGVERMWCDWASVWTPCPPHTRVEWLAKTPPSKRQKNQSPW